MAADRPYGGFYDFYSVSPKYFGFILVCLQPGRISTYPQERDTLLITHIFRHPLSPIMAQTEYSGKVSKYYLDLKVA
jgi:hypothetical protein